MSPFSRFIGKPFISSVLAALFYFLTSNGLWVQTVSTSDSIIHQAIVEANVPALKAQMKANNDAFGLPYLHGMVLALNGQTQQAIDSLRKAAADSMNPYRNAIALLRH